MKNFSHRFSPPILHYFLTKPLPGQGGLFITQLSFLVARNGSCLKLDFCSMTCPYDSFGHWIYSILVIMSIPEDLMLNTFQEQIICMALRKWKLGTLVEVWSKTNARLVVNSGEKNFFTAKRPHLLALNAFIAVNFSMISAKFSVEFL